MINKRIRPPINPAQPDSFIVSSISAFSLVEVLVTLGIVTLIFSAVLGFLIMSDNSWELGKDKLIEQQQVRIALDNIVNSLQFSSPRWQDSSGNNYTVSLATARIDFYIPVFYSNCCPDNCANVTVCTDSLGLVHESEDVQSLRRVTYKLNPNDPTQVLRKEGTGPEQVIANQIDNLSFSCGCPGCSSISDNCPLVDISITSEIQAPHNVQSTVALRNHNLTLSSGVEIEQPQEGEF